VLYFHLLRPQFVVFSLILHDEPSRCHHVLDPEVENRDGDSEGKPEHTWIFSAVFERRLGVMHLLSLNRKEKKQSMKVLSLGWQYGVLRILKLYR